MTSSVSRVSDGFNEADITVDGLDAFCSRRTQADKYPLADQICESVPVYLAQDIRQCLKGDVDEELLRAELCRVLRDGPGIFVVREAYRNQGVVDRSTELFRTIIADEYTAGQGQGDHFGDNERIWNSAQKVCLKDPDHYIDYYSNPILAAASEAWLGPGYQVTAQVNIVKPGSPAQSVHRDYHLGFQSSETIARFPAHVQTTSQYLTLQGAVAHTEMPPESGPTLLLPYSHHFPAGYLATSRPDIRTYFEAHAVQFAMKKGDMVFFSPAVFHGAGANTSQSDRVANLLQISSAFGRTMESIDRDEMSVAIYPALLERVAAKSISEREMRDVVAATSDGYAFPTNLDSDPPVDGNAPETGQQLLHRAMKERWVTEELYARLSVYRRRREP